MGTRVWDRFLSEADRRFMDGRQQRRMGFGKQPVLLLVDMYRWVFGDRPQPLTEALKDWPGSCGLAGWQALPHVQRLLTEARSAGVPVVHSTGMLEPNITIWAREKASTDGLRNRGPAIQQRLAAMYDIIDEVAPIEGELVIRKSSPSAFWGTPLIGHLVDLRADTIVLAGESTSGCVRASAVDASTNRYRLIVPEECVFDRVEASHALNLFDIDQKYGDVVPMEEVVQHFRTMKAPR